MNKYNELKVKFTRFTWSFFFQRGILPQSLVFHVRYSQEAGKLDAFIERRRRKNASKDHRYMPYRRNGDDA